MKKIITGLLLISLTGHTLLRSQEMLEIDGAITISNTTNASPSPGSIRFNAATADFEGWNGELWLSLTAGKKEGTVTDIEGNVYKTLIIGDHEWMVENLRTRRYRNGELVTLTGSNGNWSSAQSGAYCWYDNDQDNDYLYGKLYNQYAINDGRHLCPTGWRIPPPEVFADLIEHLGGAANAGGSLKQIAYWEGSNYGATNASGFSAIAGGLRRSDGVFTGMGTAAYFWTNANFQRLRSTSAAIETAAIYSERLGFSVRCVRLVN